MTLVKTAHPLNRGAPSSQRVSKPRLVATGHASVFPTRDGPKPATGAIVAAVETADGARAVLVGKLEPIPFEMAREALAGVDHIAAIAYRHPNQRRYAGSSARSSHR